MSVRRKTYLLLGLTALCILPLIYFSVDDGGMRAGLLTIMSFMFGYFGLGALFGSAGGSLTRWQRD